MNSYIWIHIWILVYQGFRWSLKALFQSLQHLDLDIEIRSRDLRLGHQPEGVWLTPPVRAPPVRASDSEASCHYWYCSTQAGSAYLSWMLLQPLQPGPGTRRPTEWPWLKGLEESWVDIEACLPSLSPTGCLPWPGLRGLMARVRLSLSGPCRLQVPSQLLSSRQRIWRLWQSPRLGRFRAWRFAWISKVSSDISESSWFSYQLEIEILVIVAQRQQASGLPASSNASKFKRPKYWHACNK